MPYVPGMGVGVQAAPQTAIQGAIPAQPLPQPSQQVNSAENILAGLYQQHAQINQQIQQSLEKAVKPISVSGAGPDVGNVMGQQRPFQRTPLDTSRRVGAHNVKMQNIGNTMKTASNIIGAAVEKRTTEKRREMALDIERIYATTDGMREAEAALKMDPNDANAKAQYEKNKNIQDALLADPKKTKMFEKAFAIDFINPQNNKTPEAAAHAQAMGSYAEQLKAKNAERMQQNTQALATYEGLKAQEKTYLDAEKTVQKDVQSIRTTESREKIAQGTQDTALNIAKIGARQRKESEEDRTKAMVKIAQGVQAGNTARTKMQVEGRANVAKMQVDGRFATAEAQIHGRLQAIQAKGTTPEAKQKLVIQTEQLLEKSIADADKQYGEALSIRSHVAPGDDQGLIDANATLYYLNQRKVNFAEQLKALQEGNQKVMEGINNADYPGRSSTTGAGAVSSASATAGIDTATGLPLAQQTNSSFGTSAATDFLNTTSAANASRAQQEDDTDSSQY